tara:strand:- start:67 stop:858 length:792 start_codon:yes stop_codon:yes gene_type:complete
MVIVAAAEPRVTDVIYILVPPPAAAGVVDCHVDPLEVKTLPEVLGATVCGADVPLPSRTLLAVSVVAPVPPLATGRVPVTPVVKGSPVVLVSTPEAGVPRAGVTSEGELAKTTAPVPVEVVPPVPPLATARVPAKVIVPPEVTGPPEVVSPVVPPETSTLVTVPPEAGVLDTQLVPSEVSILPEVPAAVTPVPPLATGRVPVTPEARFISSSVPPRVKLPELVTVPVKVRPLTVPAPLTLVTVPAPPADTYSKAVPAPFTAST